MTTTRNPQVDALLAKAGKWQFDMPAEFQAQLDASEPLASAFAALAPGRQRAYLLHFGAAKQAATRIARVQKATPHILAGKGLDDQ